MRLTSLFKRKHDPSGSTSSDLLRRVSAGLVSALKVVAVNAALLALLAVVSELVLIHLFKSPDRLSGVLRKYYREYHLKFERKVIQYQEDCAQFDPELFYTLKPGRCNFRSREFDVAFHINRLGVRDDEMSLEAPQILVVGDSHAMGWGVRQEETFAQGLEALTGKKVLNLGVSSYGTVRELKILRRVDLSRAKFLIIQYCRNDYDENKAFFENGNALPISDETAYRRVIRQRAALQSYRFGRYVYELQKKAVNGLVYGIRDWVGHPKLETSYSDAADLFLNALIHAPVELRGIRIIVFEVNFQARNDSRFADDLKRLLASRSSPDFLKNIRVADLSELLSREKYFYFWDGHPTAEGHAVIAARLAELIPDGTY